MPQNNSDSTSKFFEEGLTAFTDCQYGMAYESFRKALDVYEKTNQSRDVPEYYGLRYFKDFSKGMELLGTKGGFTRSARFFISAVIWTKKLPPELASELAPSAEFFSKIIPLDERLRGLFAHPQSFEHLSEGLNIILEPLSDILMDSCVIKTLPQVQILITARTNICMVILYLLGKLPQETLSALVRGDTPLNPLLLEGTSSRHGGIERGRGVWNSEEDISKLVLWILNQEERALMETGCDKLYELIPAVSLFAREMVRLDAPEHIFEIPEITRARLLSLLAPLRELDISAGTILEPLIRRLLKEHSIPFAATAPAEKKTYQPMGKFPILAGYQWLDLLLVIYLKAKEIEAVIGNVKKRFTFRELGLINTKTGKLNILGKALILFGENMGIITWHNPLADKKLKKQISLLSRLLKSIFPGLAGSPFYPYKQYKAYKTRFKMEISYQDDTDQDTEDSEHTPESLLPRRQAGLIRGDYRDDNNDSDNSDTSDDD